MKNRFVILFIIIPISLFGKIAGKSVLVLPVINEAGISQDHIASIMQKLLTKYFSIVKGFSSTSMHQNDLASLNAVENELLDVIQIVKIGRARNSRYVVQVVFVEDKNIPDKLIFTFKVYDIKEKRLFFTYKDTAEGDITILQTLEQIAISVVENVTGIELVFGTLIVQADRPCQVSVDGGKYVEAPYRDKRILRGMHHIKIVYNK